jgi:hypothetical protein
MHWLILFSTGQDNLKPLATARKSREIRHRQRDRQKIKYGYEQAFGLAKREMINGLKHSHSQYCRVGIKARLAPLAAALRVLPGLNNIITDPNSEAPSVDQSRVILFPVAEAVRFFGFWVFHTSRIPSLPSPFLLLCNKAL